MAAPRPRSADNSDPTFSDSAPPPQLADPAQESTSAPTPSPARQLLTTTDISRVIDRIAHQILERTGESADRGEVVLIGIPTRGSVLATRLAERLSTFTGSQFGLGSLDITLYRDDLRSKAPRALEETVMPTGGVQGRTVILVDDVLYSGRTIRAALDALRDYGRPAIVQLAVLVDRGHRELPIRADYVGKNIPTAAGDSVAVKLSEVDGYDAVELKRTP